MAHIENVLLIDDDNIFNFINKKIITMENFAQKVSSHTNGNKALADLKKICDAGGTGFPDIIFLDINMPHMDGWEFLDEFEKMPENCIEKSKVYMLTSSIDPNDIEKSKTYKTVKDFISKPLSEQTLANLKFGED